MITLLCVLCVVRVKVSVKDSLVLETCFNEYLFMQNSAYLGWKQKHYISL